VGRSEIPDTEFGKKEEEMSYRIELHIKVLEELENSYQWYEERAEGLGLRFIASVNKRLTEIAEHPERYPKKKSNYRETNIEAFPYVVIYEILKTKQVVFISYIFHAKRNPQLKYRR
jgi:plasmid stabilization system protein ParE